MTIYNMWCNHLKISIFFSEDKYKRFLEFCNENNIVYLSNLTENILDRYSSIQGVGSNKIIAIKSKLEALRERFINQLEYASIMEAPLNKVIFTIPQIKDITVYEFLNYSQSEIEKLNLTQNELEELYTICAVTLPIEESLMSLKRNLSREEIVFLKERLVEGKTLEDIGNRKGLTRERVRQIEQKLKYLIAYILKNTNFNISLKIKVGFRDEISLEEMKTTLTPEFDFLVELLKRNEIFSRPFYIDFLELFLFDKRERFFSIFHSFEFTNILTTSNVNTIREKYSSFSWIKQEEIEKIIIKLGYEKHGKYYIQNNGYKDIVELYFLKLVKTPLRVDETTIVEIVRDINSRLDYNLYQSEMESLIEERDSHLARRLEGLISRIDNIIMTDSRTYVHIDKVEYDVGKFLELKEKIVPKDTNYIDTIAIYKSLKDELNKIGIYSDYIFYSLFKYHFSQELNLTPNGNSRVLTVDGKDFNRVEELEKYLAKEGRVLEKNYIQEKLNYSNASLNNAIENSNKIIVFDRSYVGLINLVKITKNETEIIKKLIIQTSKNNSIFIPNLIGKININRELKSFVLNNNINKYLISSLIKYYFPEYKGGLNNLTRRESETN